MAHSSENKFRKRSAWHRRYNPVDGKTQRQSVLAPGLSRAHRDWITRVNNNTNSTGCTVWMVSPKQVATPVRIDNESAIRELMWASYESELCEYDKVRCSPSDIEYCVVDDYPRKVYMNYKSMKVTAQRNINVPASRILVENSMIQPPKVDKCQRDLGLYLNCFPSDHVVFHQQYGKDLVDYPYTVFCSDWKRMFPRERMPAYRNLALNRYQHYSQALMEFAQTGTQSPLVKYIIQTIMGKRVGPVSHWDQAQTAILGAALLHMYPRDWEASTETPRISTWEFGSTGSI